MPPESSKPHAAAQTPPATAPEQRGSAASRRLSAPAWGAPHPVLAAHASRLAFSMRLPGWQDPPQTQAGMMALAHALALRLSLRPELSLGIDPAQLHPASPDSQPAELEAALVRAGQHAVPDRFWPG